MHSNFDHFLHFLKNRNVDEVYFSIAIRSFALSMISIFIPIYLINYGYSLREVLIFYFELNLAHIFFIFPAAKVSSRFGFKRSILVSIPSQIIYYFLIYTLRIFNWNLLLPGIIFGMSNAFYYMGYHLDFTENGSENTKKEIGVLKAVGSIFNVLGPAIGGLIYTQFGFNTLLLFVGIIMFFSIFPLFFKKQSNRPYDLEYSGVFKGKKKGEFVAFLGHGIESGIVSIFWPIFVFFTILNDYTILGIVSSFTLIFSLIFVFLIGELTEEFRRKTMITGSLLNSFVWVFRILVKTWFQVFLIDSLKGISQTLQEVPFSAMTYDRAAKQKIISFTLFREISIRLGRAIFILLMVILIDMSNIELSFIFGAASSLLYTFF